MRRSQPDVVCACCGSVGSGLVDVQPDGTGYYVTADEPQTPPLCDTCDYAQRRWDARQYELKCFGAGYPFWDKPPVSPPVRRAGDRALGRDGWPV